MDIFAEVSNKDRTKSRGFSFNAPIESSVPPPTSGTEKSEKDAIASVWDEDDDNDDFFAEPSFKSELIKKKIQLE